MKNNALDPKELVKGKEWFRRSEEAWSVLKDRLDGYEVDLFHSPADPVSRCRGYVTILGHTFEINELND